MAWSPDYVEVSTLRDYLRVEDSHDDAVFAMAISAASRAVDRACNRQFGQVAAPELRFYTPRWDDDRLAWVADIDDLGTIAGAEVGDEAVGTGVLYPRNALVKGGVFTSITLDRSIDATDEVGIVARWGWPSVPVAIEQATLLQASRFVGRRDSPFGIAGNADAGAERIVSAKIDPDVAVSVRPYYRWWGAY